MLVGLHVTDDAHENQDRAGMPPITESLARSSRDGFRVSETRKTHKGEKFNRVPVLSFLNEAIKAYFDATITGLSAASTSTIGSIQYRLSSQ